MVFRRRRRERQIGEPRWLVDYRDKAALELASRVHQGLLQEFEPEERERAHGRTVYADPAMRAEGYAVLSQERIHLALLNSSEPRQPARNLAPVPYRLVHDYATGNDGMSVKLTLRGFLTPPAPYPSNPDDETDLVIHAGQQGRELITAILNLVDKSRR